MLISHRFYGHTEVMLQNELTKKAWDSQTFEPGRLDKQLRNKVCLSYGPTGTVLATKRKNDSTRAFLPRSKSRTAEMPTSLYRNHDASQATTGHKTSQCQRKSRQAKCPNNQIKSNNLIRSAVRPKASHLSLPVRSPTSYPCPLACERTKWTQHI